MDDAVAGVGRGLPKAAVGPGLQVFERIDDAAAQLAIDRAGAEGAMLLERAAGQAKKARRTFGRRRGRTLPAIPSVEDTAA